MLKVHPIAQYFSPMPDADYQALKDDIKKNGMLEPVWLSSDGRIIDGRHRYRAADELGQREQCEAEALTTEYSPEELPEIVLSLNLRRRHLSESQRSMVAARMRHLLRDQSVSDGAKSGKKGETIHGAAQRLNVSRRSVAFAEKVLAGGVSELVRAVDEGMIAVSAAAKALKLPPEEQREATQRVLGGDVKNMQAALRQRRLAAAMERVEKLPPVAGEYHVIVADPPWRYEHRLSDETHRGRTPYPTMSEQEIRDLKVPASDTCVLWLWCTNAYLADGTAARVTQAWGFEPKTVLTWAKPKMGVGDWLRGQTEHAILATRGRPAIRDPIPSTLLQGVVGEHSEKPEAFYQMVEAHCSGRRVELFAGKVREGWDQHGADLLSAQQAAEPAVEAPVPHAASPA
jgi:N6-adenosine-specific RNA methylase IME4